MRVSNEFKKYLDEASRIVKKWPEWKQNVVSKQMTRNEICDNYGAQL